MVRMPGHSGLRIPTHPRPPTRPAGVLLASAKLMAFHGVFTWLTFRVFGVPLAYTVSRWARCLQCLPGHGCGFAAVLFQAQGTHLRRHRTEPRPSRPAGRRPLRRVRAAALHPHLRRGAAWQRAAGGPGAHPRGDRAAAGALGRLLPGRHAHPGGHPRGAPLPPVPGHPGGNLDL